MQSCNDTRLSRVWWNVHICLSRLSQTERKSFFLRLSLHSGSLSGSMLIILEQLNGLAVWAIIHSNTFSLCWSIAKDRVRIEKVYLFHWDRRIWPQGQHDNKSSSYGVHSSLPREMTTCLHIFHLCLCLFSFCCPGNWELRLILKYGKSLSPWQ